MDPQYPGSSSINFNWPSKVSRFQSLHPSLLFQPLASGLVVHPQLAFAVEPHRLLPAWLALPPACALVDAYSSQALGLVGQACFGLSLGSHHPPSSVLISSFNCITLVSMPFSFHQFLLPLPGSLFWNFPYPILYRQHGGAAVSTFVSQQEAPRSEFHWGRAFLCVLCMPSPCLHWFLQGTLFSPTITLSTSST